MADVFYVFIFTCWENTSCDVSFLLAWFEYYRALVFPSFPVITATDKNDALTQAFLMVSLFSCVFLECTKFLKFPICLRCFFHVSTDLGMHWYLYLCICLKNKPKRSRMLYCSSSSFCLDTFTALCLNIYCELILAFQNALLWKGL